MTEDSTGQLMTELASFFLSHPEASVEFTRLESGVGAGVAVVLRVAGQQWDRQEFRLGLRRDERFFDGPLMRDMVRDWDKAQSDRSAAAAAEAPETEVQQGLSLLTDTPDGEQA